MRGWMDLSLDDATELFSKGLGRPSHVHKLARLSGGMVNGVFMADLDSEPFRAVLKVNPEPMNPKFDYEARQLDHFHKETRFPVPRYLFCFCDGKAFDHSAIALSVIDGVRLGAARLSRSEGGLLETEIAQALIDLHSHTLSRYGEVDQPDKATWAEVLEPRFRAEIAKCEAKAEPYIIGVSNAIADRLPELLARPGAKPALVHGDIWANNVMVIPDSPRILSGFLDPIAFYADPEYELAYLEVFWTVGERFFEVYTKTYPLAEGYTVRRAIYHLNTMLIHIRAFGDPEYHRRAMQLAKALDAHLGLARD
jgi:fructosamine-3-kinase